eukprot:TCONS_00033691-protein
MCGCTDGNLHFNLDKSTGLAYGALRKIIWRIEWVGHLPLPPPPAIPPSSSSIVISSTQYDLMTSSNIVSMTSSIASSSYLNSTGYLFNATVVHDGITSSPISDGITSSVTFYNQPMNNTSIEQASESTSITEESIALNTGSISSSFVPEASSSMPVDPTSSDIFATSFAPVVSTSLADMNVQPSSSIEDYLVFSSSAIIEYSRPIPTNPNATLYLEPFRNKAEISLPLSIFNESEIYQLRVEAENAFGARAVRVLNISFDYQCFPTTELRRIAHQDLAYEVVLYYPPCFDGDRNRTYQWSYSSTSLNVEIDSHLQTTVNHYVIRRSMLKDGEMYTVKVKVNESSQVNITTKTANFTFVARPLEARVRGFHLTAGWNQVLRLDGSQSRDPDSKTTDTETKAWSCIDENGNACLDINGQAITTTGDMWNLPINNLTFPTLLVNGSVPTENKFTFKLLYTKGARSAQDEVSVTILPPNTPQLVVYSSQHRISRASPVAFVAEAFGTFTETLSYSWKCYDSLDLSKKNILPSTMTQSGSMTIDQGVTKHHVQLAVLRIPGLTFLKEIDLVCECTFGENVASARVTYTRIYSPFLVRQPKSGESLATEFRFHLDYVLSGFGNSLLSYRFGYYPDTDLIPVQYLTGWTSLNYIDKVRLPLLADLEAGESKNLKIFAQIRNDVEMLDYVDHEVVLTKPSNQDTNLLSLVSKSTKEMLKYNLYEGCAFLTMQLILQPNLNSLVVKKRRRRALPESDLQTDVIELIDITMASPFQPELIDQAINTINYLIQRSNGRLHEDMTSKINDFLLHVTSHSDFMDLSGDIDYGFQFKSVLQSLSGLLGYGDNVAIIQPSLDSIIQPYIMKMLQDKDSPYLVEKDWTSDRISVKYTSFHSIGDPDTVLKIDALKSKYQAWNCSDDVNAQKCHGFYISEVIYKGSVFNNYLFNQYSGGPIADIYQIDAWFLHPDEQTYKRHDLGNETAFEVNLPLLDTSVQKGDDIQCLLWDENKSSFNESECITETLLTAGIVTCQCSRVGKIAARKTPPLYPPTTESPFLADNLTYAMYFYADDNRCSPPKYDFFRPKFKTQLCELLGISMKRMKITGCTIADVIGIIMHFYIIDKIGERRNINIEMQMDEIMEQESFKVQMNQGGDVYMFDISQTTPKPPPPTIPPIGEVTVDWVPIYISIGAVIGLFILIIVLVYCYHTKALRDKKFTKVNSDKKAKQLDEEEENEKTGKPSKKQHAQQMAAILEEDLVTEDAAIIIPMNCLPPPSSKNTQSRKRSSVAPVLDANAIAIGTSDTMSAAPGAGYASFQARQQAALEPPRLILDDEDDKEEAEEETTPPEEPITDTFKPKATVVMHSLTAVRKKKDSTPLQSLVQGNDDNDSEDGVLEMRQNDDQTPDYSNDQSLV